MEGKPIELDELSLNRVLGPPTDVSGVGHPGSSLRQMAFDLYRESAMLLTLVGSLSAAADQSLSRNHAIEAGLVVRMTKFMTSVLALKADKIREHGEVILTLNRCIAESAINLQFFCQAATEDDYEEYIRSSLRPERDQQKLIERNIEARGSELPIEARMLKSIARVFRLSGVADIAELARIPKRKDYRKILEAIGLHDAYPMLQGVPSHMVHGTWVDVVLHHVEESETGFRAKPEPLRSDARLLLPTCIIVLHAVRSYIESRFDSRGAEILLARIDDLIDRVHTINDSHEKTLSSK